MRGVEREAARTVMVFLVFAYSAFLGPACSPSESPAPTAVLGEQATADDFNSLPAIYGFTGPDNLISGQTCEVAISCAAADSDGQVKSVTADLSEIGGPASVTLTTAGSVWSWTGTLTPPVAGSRTIRFTASDNDSAKVTYEVSVVVSASPAPAVTGESSPPPSSQPSTSDDAASLAKIAIENVTVTGRMVQGRTCPITVSCSASDSNGIVQAVLADLSAIGGPAAQPLALQSDQWSWSGNVTPPTPGLLTVRIAAASDAPATASVDITVGVVDAKVLYGDWLFVLNDGRIPTDPQNYESYIEAFVRGVEQTRIPVVLLHAPLWNWKPSLSNGVLNEVQVKDLVSRLRAKGITVAFHCRTGTTYADNHAWLDEAVPRLKTLQAKVVYPDGCYFDGWPYYLETLRGVVGPDGILTMGTVRNYLDGDSTIDQGDPARPYFFAHPRQYVDWRIDQVRKRRSWSPDWWRFEVGWIGEYNFAGPLVFWPLADYQYVWERCRQAGLPLTYRTTIGSLTDWNATRLQLVGNLEQGHYEPALDLAPWNRVVMSQDGTRMVAAAYGGRLYISSDSGISWTERRPAGDQNRNWNCMAMSADGRRVLAGIWPGRLYVSADFGMSWTETSPGGDTDMYWESLAMTADGMRIAARVCGRDVYLSADGGRSWSSPQTLPSDDPPVERYQEVKNWAAIAMSADGVHMAYTDGSYTDRGPAGSLCTSTDSGQTWTQHVPEWEQDPPTASKGKSCLAMSADGTTMVAGSWPGPLFVSTNGGTAWTPAPMRSDVGSADRYWQCAAMSADGRQMVVGEWNGRLYMATHIDNAWVWRELQPAGDANAYWESVALSADGSTIIATDGERLFTSTDAGTTWTARQPAATQ